MRFALDFDDILKCEEKEYFGKVISNFANELNNIYILVNSNIFSKLEYKERQKVVEEYKKYLSKYGIPCNTVVVSNDSIDEVCIRNRIDILITSKIEIINKLKNHKYIETYDITDYDFADLSKKVNLLIDDAYSSSVSEDIAITDKPSEDKIWMKYYNNASVKSYRRLVEENQVANKSMFQTIKAANADFLHEIALKYDEEVTYGEFFDAVNELKYSLSNEYGLKKGDRVAIISPNTLATVYSIFAIQDLGMVPSMLHVYTPAEDLHNYFLNENITSVIMIGLESTYENVKKAINDTNINKVFVVPLSDSLKGINVIKAKIGTSRIYKFMTKFTKVKANYKLQRNNDVPVSCKKYLKEILKTISSCLKKFKIDYNDIFIDWNEVKKKGIGAPEMPSLMDKEAVIIHTGGTTGTAKSTLLTHQNIISNADAFEAKIQEFKRQDTLITIPPLFHILGFNNCLYLLLRVGGKVVLVNKYNKKALPKLFQKEQPEYFFAVPKIGRDMLALKDLFTEEAFSNLKYVVFGGEEVPEAFVKDFDCFLDSKKCNIQSSQSLGATEGSCSYTVTFNGSNVVGSIGIPLINLDTKIIKINELDEEIEEQPYNQVGEICYSGPSITEDGYLGMELETKNILRKHPDGKIWLHTGDLGYISKEGITYYVDRCKEMQKINGEQVFPSKIKKVILENPAVESCAIVFVVDSQYKKKSLALITLKEEYKLQEEIIKSEIMESCRKKLTKESVPFYLEVRDKLPETMYLKTNTKELQREFDEKQKKLNLKYN